jgi:hypothetical protein
MYIIVTSLYPNDKVKEVANMYLKMMTKYPDDASVCTPVVPVAVRSTLQGMRVLSIQEVKKGKFEDASAFVINRMHMFNDIQGYKWSMKNFLNIEEALKSIGM